MVVGSFQVVHVFVHIAFLAKPKDTTKIQNHHEGTAYSTRQALFRTETNETENPHGGHHRVWKQEPSNEERVHDGSNNKNGGKNNNETMSSLVTHSYGTTDVDEFRKLHREHLRRIENTRRKIENTNANANTTTLAFCPSKRFGFIAGYRNQIMALTVLVLQANHEGHGNLLLDSLWHKDTYGTEIFDPFDFYFDVEAWNRHACGGDSRDNAYRRCLPRLILYDPVEHDQWDPTTANYLPSVRNGKPGDATRPYGYTKGSTRLAARYMLYARGNGKFVPPNQATGTNRDATPPRNPAEILMLEGALRPHPALQAVVDRSRRQLEVAALASSSGGQNSRYMTLHARVEPDMQKHPVCIEKKVLSLRDIVAMVESKWRVPPVGVVFLPINREYLEKEGTPPGSGSGEPTNQIAVDNLRELNRLTNHPSYDRGANETATTGMWGGRVPVVEFGSAALEGTVYEHRPSTSGAILNYFLGLGADLFVGTEVSSFSHDLLAARFYRRAAASAAGVGSNGGTFDYRYLPGVGLREWIADDAVAPPGFSC